jgi:hypothetical protein
MVAHGKCVVVDYGVDLKGEVTVTYGIGSHAQCFSLDSTLLRNQKDTINCPSVANSLQNFSAVPEEKFCR